MNLRGGAAVEEGMILRKDAAPNHSFRYSYSTQQCSLPGCHGKKPFSRASQTSWLILRGAKRGRNVHLRFIVVFNSIGLQKDQGRQEGPSPDIVPEIGGGPGRVTS